MSSEPSNPSLQETWRRRRIRVFKNAAFTVPSTLAISYLAYRFLLPNYRGPVDLSQRLAFAVQCAFFALIPLVAMKCTSMAKRLLEGAYDPLDGSESRGLRIHNRVRETSLEQYLWFSASTLAISTRLQPSEMKILPILTGLFIASRLLYWWKYANGGPLHRSAPGQVTLTVNLGLFIGTILIFAVRGVS